MLWYPGLHDPEPARCPSAAHGTRRPGVLLSNRSALSEGTHVVVGTPGRLRDHLERRTLDLSALRAVVLDEADEMLDMGFREELEAILAAAPAERRTT